MGKVFYPLIPNYPLMLWRTCLICGQLTLTYYNSLCPDCNTQVNALESIETKDNNRGD